MEQIIDDSYKKKCKNGQFEVYLLSQAPCGKTTLRKAIHMTP